MTTPVDITLSQSLRGLAEGLDETLKQLCGEKVGFLLLVRQLNTENAPVQYVANVARVDATKLIEELLLRWHQQMPDIPTHERH